MPGKYFLKKCIVVAEDMSGSYNQMSQMAQDPQIKKQYEQMKTDISKHLHFLNERMNYFKQQEKQS